MITKIRKDIDLTEPIIKILQGLAKADGRKLKNYMEKVLNNHAADQFNKITHVKKSAK